MYHHLQGNLNGRGLQFEVPYWPALAVGGAAQLAAAHCPNERSLDPQSAARLNQSKLSSMFCRTRHLSNSFATHRRRL